MRHALSRTKRRDLLGSKRNNVTVYRENMSGDNSETGAAGRRRRASATPPGAVARLLRGPPTASTYGVPYYGPK